MGFFEIFAECAIAFTGFGAIHAALRGSDSPRGVFRSWTVVLHGALAFILGILPLLFALTSLSHEQIWRALSIAGLMGAGLATYVNIVFDVRLVRLGNPPQAPVILRVAQSSSSVAVIAMLINLFGWPWSTGPLLYAAGSLLILIPGLMALLHAFLMPLQIALNPDSADH